MSSTTNIIFQVTTPPTAPSLSFSSGGSLGNGNYMYAVSFITNLGETLMGNPTAATPSGGTLRSCTLSNIPTGDSNCSARKIYRTAVDDTVLKYIATINDNTTTTYVDTMSDGRLGLETTVLSNNIDPQLNLGGILNLKGFIKATVASATIAFVDIADGVTANGAFNKITITDAIAADLGTLDIAILNNYVSESTSIIATTQTPASVFCSISAVGTGKYIIHITNVSGGALSDDVVIFTQIIN